MEENLFIGVMSGTSMDGIDSVLAAISENKVITKQSYSNTFSAALRAELEALTLPGNNEIDRMGEAGIKLAEEISDAINNLLEQAKIQPEQVKAIGCHGQTIRHRPNFEKPFSLQIGDPSTIAHKTGITTITDFRMADLAAGGQGAPLVPAFHQSAFGDSETKKVILNIGGIANISLLSDATNDASAYSGYDTGPGNMLMDSWIYKCQGKTYDKDGEWARSGNVNEQLLEKLLDTSYFKLKAPKSTGKELFNLHWLREHLQNTACRDQDVQRTLLELTVKTISGSIIESTDNKPCNIYVCGGGINNKLLMETLTASLPSYAISSTAELGIDPQLVEATAFAWLARQTLNNLPGNAPSVTGATRAKILGGIYPA